MKLAIASDHGGFFLKNVILALLQSKQVACLDLGVSSDTTVDYPDFASQVAEKVSRGEVDGGILVCGTGIGMAITANKFKRVRAAVLTDIYTAKMSKAHNDVNVIALGGRTLEESLAKEIVSTWLETSYEGGRHDARLNKIKELENKHFK